MTPDEIVMAAERAANVCGGASKGGFLADCGARKADLEAAARYVRAHPDAAAEALFLSLRREPIAWADLQATKRVAVEIFRASLLLMDRLAREDAARAEAGRERPPAPASPVEDNPLLEAAAELSDRWY